MQLSEEDLHRENVSSINVTGMCFCFFLSSFFMSFFLHTFCDIIYTDYSSLLSFLFNYIGVEMLKVISGKEILEKLKLPA